MGRRRNGAATGAFVGSLLGSIAGGAIGSLPLAAAGSVAGGAVGGGVGARSDRRRRGATGGALGGLLAAPGAALGAYWATRKPDAGFTRRRNPDLLGELERRDPELATELVAAACAFERAIPDALDDCFERYEPKRDVQPIYVAEETALVVFSTLCGGDVAIWDGRWDVYYPKRKRRHWNRLQACLRAALADEIRRLEDALVAAMYILQDNPSQRRARRLARKLTR